MKPPKGGFFIYFEFRDREIFVNIKKILKGCLIDLKRSWTVLLVVVLPMVLIMAALPYYAIDLFSFWSSFLFVPLVTIVLPLATTILMLVVVYRARQEKFSVNPKSLIFFVIATVFVVIATLIGYAMLVVPGIIVNAVSFLYPVFIFKQNKGPIESVVASARLFKGYYTKYLLIFVAVGLVFFAIDASIAMIPITGFILEPEVVLSTTTSTIYSIFQVLAMINLYDEMHQLQHGEGEKVESTPS